MSSPESPVCVILVGRDRRIGQMVVSKLQPEIEVTEFYEDIEEVQSRLQSVLVTDATRPNIPKHVIFDKAYGRGTVVALRSTLGDAASDVAFYCAAGDLPPGPMPDMSRLTDAQLDFVTGKVAENLKNVVTKNVGQSSDLGGIYDL